MNCKAQLALAGNTKYKKCKSLICESMRICFQKKKLGTPIVKITTVEISFRNFNAVNNKLGWHWYVNESPAGK